MTDEKNKYKIMIVDDDKFLLDMYSIKFTESNYDVATASNGIAAIEKMEQGQSVDIFLVDIIMPEMDGFALVAEIKKRPANKDAAIVILSNLGSKDDVDKGLELGVDGYIIKASATPSEVVTKVNDIMSHKHKI